MVTTIAAIAYELSSQKPLPHSRQDPNGPSNVYRVRTLADSTASAQLGIVLTDGLRCRDTLSNTKSLRRNGRAESNFSVFARNQTWYGLVVMSACQRVQVTMR